MKSFPLDSSLSWSEKRFSDSNMKRLQNKQRRVSEKVKEYETTFPDVLSNALLTEERRQC